MFIKILLVGSLVFAGMLIIKDGRILARAGLTASCSEVSTRSGQDNVVQACKRGRLEGYPNLTQKSCVSIRIRQGVQYWTCPAPVVASQAPRP
jgi:hypothetical protein